MNRDEENRLERLTQEVRMVGLKLADICTHLGVDPFPRPVIDMDADEVEAVQDGNPRVCLEQMREVMSETDSDAEWDAISREWIVWTGPTPPTLDGCRIAWFNEGVSEVLGPARVVKREAK